MFSRGALGEFGNYYPALRRHFGDVGRFLPAAQLK
jgi:hypothetical protein